jgi:hypothetical protein
VYAEDWSAHETFFLYAVVQATFAVVVGTVALLGTAASL